MNFVLEKHKFFPYIAWTLVIGFVVFTYTLTIELTEATEQLSSQQQQTVAALKATEE